MTLATSGGATLENDLTVPVSLSDGTAAFTGGDFALAGPATSGSVTFPAGSAGGTRTVDVLIAEDVLVEGAESFSAALGTATPASAAGSPQTITITDNEAATVSFVAAASDAVEATTPHSVQAALEITAVGVGTPAIQSAVTVAVTQAPGTAATPADYTVVTASLNFPAGSADGTTRAINNSIVADDIDEADETFTLGLGAVTGAATAAGTHQVTIRDDDIAGFIVTESGGDTAVTEGSATDTYTVVLTSRPTADVTVNLAFDPAQLALNGDTDGALALTFTPAAWDSAQTVSVAAVNDTVVEGDHTSTIVQDAISADPRYNGIVTENVEVGITDNDTAEVIFSSAGFTVVEGATFLPGMTLKVTANGASDGSIAAPIVVDLGLMPGTADAGDVSVTTARATFPAGSAHDAVVLTHAVVVIDDRVVERSEGFALNLSIASGAAATTASNAYMIISDDTAAVSYATAASAAPETVTPHSITARLTISGTGTGTARIAEVLVVAITQTPGTATTPADYSLTATSITFAAGSLNAATTAIEVGIVNDALIEGEHSFTLGFGAVTTDLTGVSASGAHTVTITDDDGAGVTIDESDGATSVVEGGASDTFTIALRAEPTSNVTISFAVGTQVTFAPATLVFTPANWSVPQMITVAAVDDAIVEGAHSTIVGFSFAGDADFAALAPNAFGVTVAIADNDSPTPTTHTVYLPLLSVPGDVTDLVVEQITTEGGQLSVVIANQGSTPISTPFWVDLLIAPTRAPHALRACRLSQCEHALRCSV